MTFCPTAQKTEWVLSSRTHSVLYFKSDQKLPNQHHLHLLRESLGLADSLNSIEADTTTSNGNAFIILIAQLNH